MADSVILAIARGLNAIIWTQDSDFEKMDRVKYRAAKLEQHGFIAYKEP